ncbi:MAG: hypothetical protein R3A47_01175 [Polyangiales bacterium]
MPTATDNNDCTDNQCNNGTCESCRSLQRMRWWILRLDGATSQCVECANDDHCAANEECSNAQCVAANVILAGGVTGGGVGCAITAQQDVHREFESHSSCCSQRLFEDGVYIRGGCTR